MDIELKNLMDKMCNAQYQSDFFSAAGMPFKKPSRFIIEENENKIIKLWKEIKCHCGHQHNH